MLLNLPAFRADTVGCSHSAWVFILAQRS
jgi:hypothetical protein